METEAPLLLVIDVLEQLGVTYCIGGSFASSVYGEPRMTRDADIVMALRLQHVVPFFDALAPAFYVQLEDVQDVVARAQTIGDDLYAHATCNLLHRVTFFKIDCFIAPNRSFDQQQLIRRIAKPLSMTSSRTVYFTSAEDSILAKLAWYAASNGALERQWSDVRAIIKAQASTLDRAYLDDWATRIGVRPLLDAVFQTDRPLRLSDGDSLPEQTRLDL